MKNRKGIFKELSLHLLVWLCLYGVMLFQSYSRTGEIDIFSNLSPRFLVNMGMFYLNYYFLVSVLLLKKRIVWYVLVSITVIFFTSYVVDALFPPEMILHIREAMKVPPEGFPPTPAWEEGRNFHFRMLIGPSSVNMIFYFILGAIVRVYVEWNKNERIREKTENEKINSELQFLKTQLNPHFLFNSLNAVYTLSIKKSSDTSEAILNLSELMRYMIYEANKETVALEKELNYIKNYIQLQRLRLPHHEQVTFNIYGDDKDKEIRPLLFISFIENAFKYGTDYQGRTNVKINISITEQGISLLVRNKIGVIKKAPESSGIGLQNIQNRLRLLYPDQHELKIDNDGTYYTIHLTIYTKKA